MLNLDKSVGPVELCRQIERIDEDLKNHDYKDDWAQNLQHAAGFLTTMTKSTQASLVGTGLKLTIQRDRYGSPSPLDILRPILSRFLGRHLALFGGVQAVPKTGTQEDKDQADAVDKVAKDKWESSDLDVVAMEALNFSQSCSHGFVLIEADDTLKPPKLIETPEGEQREIREGDVIYKSLSPFQVAVDPGCTSLYDSSFVLIKEFLIPEEIKRRWPGIDLTDAKEALYDQQQLDAIAPELKETRYIVKRLFLKPDPYNWPNGAQYVFVGKEPYVVKGSQIPNEAGQPMWVSNQESGEEWIGTYDLGYPVVDFRDEPLRFSFWGRGRQTAARPLLKVACSVWSRIAQILSLPLILVTPEGTVVNLSSDMPDVPFVQIEYNAAVGAPQYLSVPHLNERYEFLTRCIGAISEIYAQHGVSRGEMPPSRTPAETVKSLQQQDALADTPVGKMVLKALNRLFKRLIGEGLRVWPEEYTVTVVGEDKRSKSYTLRKKKLDLGADIRVIPGEDTQKTRSALVKELAALAQSQIYEPKHIRRMLGNPIPEDMYDPNEHHMEKIRQEEIAFEEGTDVPIHKADNHALHIEEHERRQIERWTLQPDLKRKRESDVRDKHLISHVQTAAAALQPAAPPATPGAVPGSGPPQPM